MNATSMAKIAYKAGVTRDQIVGKYTTRVAAGTEMPGQMDTNEQREVLGLANQDVVLDLMARFGQDVGARADQHNADVMPPSLVARSL